MINDTSTEERKHHLETMNRSIGLGVSGGLVATVAAVFAPESVSDLFLFAGVGCYYLGVVGYLAIWRRTGVRLFDEREQEIERRASQFVALLVIFVTVFGIPADVVLETTEIVDVPLVIRGAVWGYGLLCVVAALAYGYVENQYS